MSTNMVFDENGHAEQHNYSVDQIERCIVMDNPLGNKYSDDEKKKMYADLSARVDKLLYKAKQNGRNRTETELS